jgi:(p)ppGpp synthase/HD superfamily hydrolase
VIAAKALACEGLDAPAIAASLVREALALGRAGPRDVAGEFGEETASLAAGSLDQDGDAPDSDARRVERYRRLLATSLREPRALAVWLASRLFGMIAFPLLPLPQQEPFAQETLDFCAPLAGGLGLLRLKASLEDMSFSVLRPWDYRDIMSRMQAARAGRREYVAETCAALERKVREYGLPCVATGRAKHAFGIWRKMILQNLPFETILDLYSFRLRVASDEACYPALGIVHCHFPALPGRLKDYIALSAEDGYRSLHTAVVGPEGIHIEIRIGSADMRGRRGDDLEGLLAREPPCAGDAPGTVRASLGRLLETLEGAGDPASMLARFRKALDPAGPVLAFTPDGIPLKLTQGATPIDFAYMLHPLIGGRLSQAYVGGRPVELGRPLWNLSTVRIETDQGARPAPAWLSMAASPKTRAMIRRALAPPRGRARGTGL